MFDAAIRDDFPTLSREVKPGVPLIYLDSAATSQKPNAVIDAMTDYYRRYNSNVHRGIHTLSEEATAGYEGARLKIARFINAPSEAEVIFTRHTTEAINLVAWTWGLENLGPGAVLLSTQMEHHANLVPWQMLAARTGATLRYVPVTPDGMLDQEAYTRLLNEENVRLVAFSHMSNVLGSIQPVKAMVAAAHAAGAVVLVDGAQGVPHLPVDVQALDADFYAFSAHKMLGPTGIGVLYGKRALLEAMPPFMGGGDMIKKVTLEGTTYNELPWKFEAGTPAIAEAIGLGAAVDYLEGLGMQAVHAHEQAITSYALERLAEVPFVEIVGPPTAEQRGGVAAMLVDGVHPHDVSQLLDGYGIAIRAGKHCAHPIHDVLEIQPTARASFYIYTVPEEIDALVEGLYKVKDFFG
ncbi:MAG: cysteine desulfurase [Chloroflexi bacterium]|nr:cysteine desulfurase [Chloroflexota bacterium]